jgi:hypothetical protein
MDKAKAQVCDNAEKALKLAKSENLGIIVLVHQGKGCSEQITGLSKFAMAELLNAMFDNHPVVWEILKAARD